jgi:hypothetical protein
MTLFLGLALLVNGHHPLPKQFPVDTCIQAERALRASLKTGSRPQRLRALAILNRCNFRLPLAALQVDRDMEIRLSAWRIILSNTPIQSPLWQRAYETLPISQARSILRLQRRTQRHLDALQRTP